MHYLKLFSGLMLLLTSLVTIAETIESTEYKYYVISPRSPYEIKPELARLSPIREAGGTFNGHTDWYIEWKFQATPVPDGCELNDIRTTVHVVHTLPALSEQVTDKQTIEVFNKFVTALTQHEKNHGNNGLSAAREMDMQFSEIPQQTDCHQLSRMVNDIGNSTVQKYIHADNEYDRTTHNGMAEGAVIY